MPQHIESRSRLLWRNSTHGTQSMVTRKTPALHHGGRKFPWWRWVFWLSYEWTLWRFRKNPSDHGWNFSDSLGVEVVDRTLKLCLCQLFLAVRTLKKINQKRPTSAVAPKSIRSMISRPKSEIFCIHRQFQMIQCVWIKIWKYRHEKHTLPLHFFGRLRLWLE